MEWSATGWSLLSNQSRVATFHTVYGKAEQLYFSNCTFLCNIFVTAITHIRFVNPICVRQPTRLVIVLNKDQVSTTGISREHGNPLVIIPDQFRSYVAQAELQINIEYQQVTTDATME